MWETYLRFVEARHQVWGARQIGLPAPWTDEPLVATRKFTNVYRILDVGSQYLARMLWESPETSPRDVLAQCLLYRTTNRPEPWEAAREEWGRTLRASDMDADLAMFWQDWRDAGGQVFSGAYVIRPEPPIKGADKIATMVAHARRTAYAIDELRFLRASQAERFEMLKAFPGIGDFIAMQVLTDYGYSPLGEDREHEFVVPGPGAVKGAEALNPGTSPINTIYAAHKEVKHLRLGDRPPSLMDVQNTLCEFSKYVRYLGRPVGSPYVPAHPGDQPEPFIPPHWSH